jgi:hypothetical protein
MISGVRTATTTTSGLRADLVKRGVQVVSSFSRDDTARVTAAAYEELRGTADRKHHRVSVSPKCT